ncbi:MAG TPA: hypothetical protein VN581_00660 [Patescibacteria group bacterium]|nr:hypothetical protein [Patescibacteria group bacterium]
MSSPFLRLWVLAGFSLALAGCGLFGKNEMRERYLDAESGKSLEVPPGLDAPDRRESMRVPDADGELVAVSEAPVDSLPVDADDPQSRLKVRMAPEQTFDKVLAALEQAQIATVGDTDRAELRVELGFQVTEENKRWWWKDGTRTNTIRRTVHVVEDAVGSRVVIEEGDSGVRIDDEYAQRVLSALRDRINWE